MTKKIEVTNTARLATENPLALLFTAFPGGIEEQEAAGQREVVASTVLPTNGSDNPAWAAMGVVFGDPVHGDPLFREATLPPGWSKVATDHAMWNRVLDDKGRARAEFFYKAAFYDRDAFIRLLCRFGIRRVCREPYSRSAPYQHEVTDCGERVFATAEVPQPAEDKWQAHESIEQAQRVACREWLNVRYPDWRDATAHWDDES